MLEGFLGVFWREDIHPWHYGLLASKKLDAAPRGVLGEVGDSTRLPRARSVVKLAGMNLYKTQSGKSEDPLSITKRGRSLLRKMAYQLAVASIGENREFTNYYQRKRERGKAKQSAWTALGAKIFRVRYGVGKNKETYRSLQERINPQA